MTPFSATADVEMTLISSIVVKNRWHFCEAMSSEPTTLEGFSRRMKKALDQTQPLVLDDGSVRGSARSRLELMLDPDSFEEHDLFVTQRKDKREDEERYGDGVVVGHGTIDGRRVQCFSQDFSFHGGSMGEMHARKIVKAITAAERNQIPLIGIWDGGGQRIHDGVQALGETGALLDKMVSCSGRIPMFSIIVGPVAGVSALAAGLADFVVISEKQGQMFLSSPLMTPEVRSGAMDACALGGARVHSSRSGIATITARSEEEALKSVSPLLQHLPAHHLGEPLPIPTDDPIERRAPELNDILPENINLGYDMREVITKVVDDAEFFELSEAYAANILIGFARLEGRSVGIIANQPSVLAGTLDIDSSAKAARFIRTCDAFNIPLLTFEDVPGFLPGTVQEWGGIIRHGAKLLYAYSEATVPKMTVVVRKAYGGAYLAMSCKHLQSDYNVAWPSAELAVMGAEGAVNIIHRRTIKSAPEEKRESVRTKLVDEYRKQFSDPYMAARHGWLDDVIEPEKTREHLAKALRILASKRVTSPSRKHGNIPL